MTRADELIRELRLEPHAEGGYFREIIRSGETLPWPLPARYDGGRCLFTNIYFMLRGADVSHLHRLASDEMWHFLEGSPTEMAIIGPDGNLETVRLGAGIASGEQFTVLLPRGSWFGASVAAPAPGEEAYSLFSCTVVPGFDYRDFELGLRDELLQLFPQHEEIICKLT